MCVVSNPVLVGPCWSVRACALLGRYWRCYRPGVRLTARAWSHNRWLIGFSIPRSGVMEGKLVQVSDTLRIAMASEVMVSFARSQSPTALVLVKSTRLVQQAAILRGDCRRS